MEDFDWGNLIGGGIGYITNNSNNKSAENIAKIQANAQIQINSDNNSASERLAALLSTQNSTTATTASGTGTTKSNTGLIVAGIVILVAVAGFFYFKNK